MRATKSTDTAPERATARRSSAASMGPVTNTLMDSATLLELQRTHGNAFVQRLVSRLTATGAVQREPVTTSRGVELDVTVEAPYVVAKLAGTDTKVGEFELATKESPATGGDVTWLLNMDVSEAHRRQGIGTALMEYCVANMEPFLVPTTDEETGWVPHHGENADELFLTEEGAALVDHCVGSGILPVSYCEVEAAGGAEEEEAEPYQSDAARIAELLDGGDDAGALAIVNRDIDTIESIREPMEPSAETANMGLALGALRSFAEGEETLYSLRDRLREVAGIDDPTVLAIVAAYTT